MSAFSFKTSSALSAHMHKCTLLFLGVFECLLYWSNIRTYLSIHGHEFLVFSFWFWMPEMCWNKRQKQKPPNDQAFLQYRCQPAIGRLDSVRHLFMPIRVCAENIYESSVTRQTLWRESDSFWAEFMNFSRDWIFFGSFSQTKRKRREDLEETNVKV